MPDLSRLTSTELKSSLTSVQTLLDMRKHGLLEPVMVTKLTGLGVDLEAELSDRKRIDREARAAAMARSTQPA